MTHTPLLPTSKHTTPFDISVFEVDKETQMVNATKMCQSFSKDINQWRRLPNTKKLFQSFERMNPLCENYITVKQGFSDDYEQGTWIHRKLAIELARWLNTDFAMFTLDKLDELFQKGKVELNPTPTLENPIDIIRFALESLEAKDKEISKQKTLIDSLEPKVQVYDLWLTKGRNLNLRESAAKLKLAQNEFIQYLLDKRHIYQNSKKEYRAYSIFQDWFTLKSGIANNHAFEQLLITPVGLCEIAQRLRIMIESGSLSWIA